MRRSSLSLALLLPLAAACGGGGGGAAPAAPPPSVPPPSSAPPSSTVPPTPVSVPTCEPVKTSPIQAKDFPSPTKIDSKWMPLAPGTRFVLEGRANRGGGVLPHQIAFTVTSLTKVINGVPNVVTWDVDTGAKGVLQEAELAFFAQDADGNIWNFGEYPEEYGKNGKFSGAPSTWIAGQGKAEAGVQVPAKVSPGKPEVLQGLSPDVEFLDCAKDVKVGEKVCVPTGCYDGSRVVDERSPLAPDSGVQRKTYAPGLGNVKVEAVGDPEGETLVLIARSSLSPAELDKANAEAKKLDEHGRATHPVYKDSAPLQ
ncbi:MAG TPA: hypothetical protein VJX66_03520 [Amycolatopsis sp.]|nr:hypothetical protein [Amycolatopsis sp.]